MSAPGGDGAGRPPVGMLAVVAGALVGTLMLLAPAQVYYANHREFARDLSQGWLPQCGNALVAFALVLGCLRWLIPARQAQAAATLVVGVTSLLWVQGGFFSGDIGRLDGGPKAWNLGLAAGSTLMWLGVLVGAYRARRQMAPHLSFVAAGLLLVQALGLATTIAKSPPGHAPPYRFQDTDMFTYSRSGNVVILVVDSAQSAMFRELLLEEDTREAFSGFTFYTDALGGYPTTVASVPLILSGRYYDNSVTLEDFWAQITPHLVPTRLRTLGYNAFVQPIEMLPARPVIADNVVPNSFDSQDWRRLWSLTTFRMLPSPVRMALYDRTRVINTPQNVAATPTDLQFLHAMERRWSVVDGPPRFKYYHLFGMHLPFSLDEQLRAVPGTEATWAAARRQARAEIEILRRWLRRLRSDELYDSSLLIVLGDHGAPPLEGQPVAAGDLGTGREPDEDGFPVSLATPLLLVKPFGAHGPLKTSAVAATLADVSATVAAAAKLPPDGGAGRPLTETDPGKQRLRSYYHYGWDGDWNRAYVPTMVEFEVRGPAHETRSWRRTGRVLLSGKASRTPEYRYGTILEAAAEGPLAQYCGAGFSGPESGLMWTSAPTAQCVLPTMPPPAGSALRLTLDLLPHLGPGLDRQVVRVTANGQEVGTRTLLAPSVVRIFLPPGLVERELRLGLALPTARAPLQLGTSADPRRLGAAVRSLRIDPVMMAPSGTSLDAGQGGAAEPYLGDGWSTPEPGLTWTDGAVASIILPVTPPPSGSAVRLALAVHPHLGPGLDRQVVRLTANGTDVGTWTLSESLQMLVDLPPGLVGSELRLVLHLPNARSPKDLGSSPDPRRLGVALSSLRIDSGARAGATAPPSPERGHATGP